MKTKGARILPHSLETEQCVLGCVLIDKDAAFNILSALKKEDFYEETHKIIFENMYSVYAENFPVDFVTLTSELDKNNLTDSVGGVEYITNLTNMVPSASDFKHYIELVKRDSVLRQLISASNEIINYSFAGNSKEEAIQFAEKNIFEIAQNEERGDLADIKTSLDKVITKFEQIQKDPNSLKGISTGLYGIDRLTNGLQNSDLILIAARPSFGKTSLGMNIVAHACLKENKKCAIFSIEMSKEQLVQRLICSVGFVDMGKAIRGELDVKDWKSLWGANELLKNSNMFIDEGFSNSPMDIISKCRKLKREQGLDLIMIDYLQLMSAGGGKVENRQQEISSITRSLKIAARELNVPIILLSQLSRGPESRASDHRPRLSDLRESGAIEQDADVVIMIYRPDNYTEDSSKFKQNEAVAELIVAKNRNGACETVEVKWIGNVTSFVNLDKDLNYQSLEKSLPSKKDKGEPQNTNSVNKDNVSDNMVELDDNIIELDDNLDDLF